MNEILIAKLNNKLVEIVRVVETVQFSDEKDWILIDHQIGKRQSMRWVKASEVQFEWVRSYIK